MSKEGLQDIPREHCGRLVRGGQNLTRFLPKAVPDELVAKPALVDLYRDLVAIREALDLFAKPSTNDARLTRSVIIAFSRHLQYRQRRELKAVCRCKQLTLKSLFTTAEYQDMIERPQVFQDALTDEDLENLQRAVDFLYREGRDTHYSGTALVWKVLRSRPEVPKSQSAAFDQAGEAENSQGEKQVMIPSVLSYYQFALGKRRPQAVETEQGSGRLLITFPGKPRQLELWEAGTPLSMLQNCVHSALGNPVTSKIVVASLYLHQEAVRLGALPGDTVRVHYTEMARLIGNSAIRGNGSIDPDFQQHFWSTFFVLSMLRAVWIPDSRGLLNGADEWLRSPIYNIDYEKGRGEATAPPDEIGYSFGRLFQAFMYGGGQMARCVAPLDLDQYFAWHSKNEADEQMLHLFYTQMFQIAMSANQDGVYRDRISNVLDESGLTLMRPKHMGEAYDKFLDATEVLKKYNIVGSYHIENKDAPLSEQFICVEPSLTVKRRIQEALA